MGVGGSPTLSAAPGASTILPSSTHGKVMNISATVKFGLMEACLGSCCLPGAPRLCRNRILPKATLHMHVWLDACQSLGRVAKGRGLTGDPAGTQAGQSRAHATFLLRGPHPTGPSLSQKTHTCIDSFHYLPI